MTGTPPRAIGAYRYTPAELLPSDPRAPRAAATVRDLLARRFPAGVVDHIGSTAVTGCPGKGIVDLMLIYPQGSLAQARDAVDSLGFQPQTFGDPFPEERPMRVGTVDISGRAVRVHVHVIADSSPEVAALRSFRDRLRADPVLCAAYSDYKRRLISAGITGSPDYSESKGAFIRAVLSGVDPPTAIPTAPRTQKG